jgi:hypothetical protein
LPTNYYEQTTPYGNYNGSRFKRYTLDPDEDLRFDDNEENVDDDNDFNMFDDEDDFKDQNDFIEAFNPNVHVDKNLINFVFYIADLNFLFYLRFPDQKSK